MKSSNAFLVGKNFDDANNVIKKRQMTELSIDIERENGLYPTAIEDSKAIKQLQIRYSKKRRYSFSTIGTQTHKDVKCARRLSEPQKKESQMMERVRHAAISVPEKNNYSLHMGKDFDQTRNLVARELHLATSSRNTLRPITPVISNLGMNLKSDEYPPKTDSYTVKRLLNDTSKTAPQDTNNRTSNVEQNIGRRESLQHIINTLEVSHALPCISIEVGEDSPVVLSSEMFPSVRRDFSASASPLDQMALSSMNIFPFSLQPLPSTLTNMLFNNLSRSSDRLLSHWTLQNILRSTTFDHFIASYPLCQQLLAREIMLSPSMSRCSLHFGSPYQHAYIPPLVRRNCIFKC
jgi:hypothetical protein